MDTIIDELSRIELLRMREGLVGDLENGGWMVLDHPEGKFIVDSTLHVGAVLPRASIKKLKKRSKRKFFKWTVEDGSLSVQGRRDCWNLAFKMGAPPDGLVVAVLSAAETEAVKQHLLKQ